MRCVVMAVLLASGSVFAEPAPGPSANELVDWVDAKLAAIQSLELEFETIQVFVVNGYKTTATMSSVTQAVRQGATFVVRADSDVTTESTCVKPGCQLPAPVPRKREVELHRDGMMYRHVLGQPTAQRTRITGLDVTNPLLFGAMLRETLRVQPSMRRLRDETIDGERTHVVSYSIVTLYISATTGLILKMVVSKEIEGHAIVQTTRRKRLVVGKAIPAERFRLPSSIKVE
jgi:hypothetical protein